MNLDARKIAAFLLALLFASGAAVLVRWLASRAYFAGEAAMWPMFVLPPLAGLAFFGLVFGVFTGGSPSARFWFVAPIITVVASVLAYLAVYRGVASPLEATTFLICGLAIVGGVAYGRNKPLP